jgi:mono/diheme cytochrome c family protein
MKKSVSSKWILVAFTATACMAAAAQQQATGKVDVGKRDFDSNCAVCHGTSGKGNGPYAPYLKSALPDLTTLARRNGGFFPMAKVYETIEAAGTGHGSRDMPVWGKVFSVEAADYYFEVPVNLDAIVRGRMLTLAEYVNRLQVK